MSNPLLGSHELPPFGRITPEHASEAIPALIERNLRNIDELLRQDKQRLLEWNYFIKPLEQWDDELSQAWSPVSHLNSVANTPALRTAYHDCLSKLTDYGNKVGQNQALYAAYCALRDSPTFATLTLEQHKVIEEAILDFTLSGVGLSEQNREKFAELNKTLSQLQNSFQDNVMDATDAWHLTIDNVKRLAGMPEKSIALAKQTAEKENEAGWRLTLDFPCYSAVMTYAEDATLRQTLHEAYSTRASEVGPLAGKYDNSELIEKILQIRHEMANLLGYDSFAKKSLAKKMAKSPEEVISFLTELADRTKPFAQKEWETLQAFAKEEYGISKLEPWDVGYYSEKLRQKNFAISQEELRAYFPVPVVINGLFEVVHRLFGLSIRENKNVETWHPDVQFFDIFDRNNEKRGGFYLDIYARQQKRGGAWMDEARVRRKNDKGELQYPIAYLTCNFREPIGDEPSLLTHEEVITLFHEFGHGIHHMLTKMEYPSISGINGVPWDVVEVPSQFMENWCWQNEALQFLSSHFKTHEPLSKEWLEKMHRAKNFQSAMMLIRQLEFSIFDYRLHLEYDPSKGARVREILKNVRDAYSVVPHAPYARFSHSFTHVFAGGYAAGYYSYLWAEVLACDAFSKFEEEGIFNPQTGREFLEKVLEVGGSVAPDVWFKNFRGRAPKLDAFLKAHGIQHE